MITIIANRMFDAIFNFLSKLFEFGERLLRES